MALYRARSTSPAWRQFALSAATAFSLVACGGGSGGDPSTKPPATVADTSAGANPTPVSGGASDATSGTSSNSGTSSGGSTSPVASPITSTSPSGNPAPYSHYQAMERDSSQPGGIVRRTLDIIDTDTGAVVQHYALGSSSGAPDSLGNHGPDWFTIPRFVPTADRLGQIYNGPGLLHFIQNGQIMQLDLSGATLGTARPVSSAKACWFKGDYLPFKADASQFWLTVFAADDAAHCPSTALLSTYVQVATDMDASGAPQPNNAHAQLLDTLYDAQGQVLGLLAVDRSDLVSNTIKLAVWSPDLRVRLQTLTPSPAVKISGLGNIVRRIAMLPGDARQSLIQIDNNVHKLDWRSGQAVLSAALFTQTHVIDQAVMERDAQYVYLADGCLVRRIDANGVVSTAATVPPDSGHIVQLAGTGDTLVTVQANRTIQANVNTAQRTQCSDTMPDGQARLRAINKRTQTVSLLDTGGIMDFRVVGRAGQQFFAATTDAYVSTAVTSIKRYDPSGVAAPATVADKVKLLGAARRLLDYPGLDSQDAQLILCTLGALGDCRGGQLVSYAMNTSLRTTLGALPDSAPASAGTAFSFTLDDIRPSGLGLWANKPGLLTLSTSFSTAAQSGNTYLNTPWWFKPGGTNTLREVSPAP